MSRPIPTNEEYLHWAREWKKWDKEFRKTEGKLALRKRNAAATAILEGLRGMIWHMVQRYHNRRPEYWEDVVALANEAILSHGLHKWDEKKAKKAGSSFASYMAWWIRHAVTRGTDYALPVHIPHNRHLEALSARRRLRESGAPIPEELKPYLPSFVSFTFNPANADLDSESDQWMDWLTLESGLIETDSVEKHAQRMEAREKLWKLMEGLTHRRKLVLMTMLGHPTLNLRQIGEALGVSHQAIHQLREAAIRSMRHAAKAQEKVA